MATVILGTGIIGTATAYYLSKTETTGTIHLVEPADELFSSASGFAGGFLSKDWFSGPMRSLAEVSFAEHRDLASAHDGASKWGYRSGAAFSYQWPERTGEDPGGNWLLEGTSRSGAAVYGAQNAGGSEDVAPSWQTRYPGDRQECIGLDTVAQVDPLKLSRFLLQECLGQGVVLHHPAKALSVAADNRGELASIRIAETTSSTETDVPCTRVIIAAGCWSPEVFKALFPASGTSLPISALSGHSLLVRSPRLARSLAANERAHAIFASKIDGYAPEAFSWADGSIYVAGVNSDSVPLPALPSDAKKRMSSDALALLRKLARRMLGAPSGTGAGDADEDEDDLEVVREALCYRPVTGLGRPFICRIPDEQLGGGVATRPGAGGGVFLAAGHGPWGISLSLGTGKAVAELVRGQPSSIGGDLESFVLTAPTLEHTYHRT